MLLSHPQPVPQPSEALHRQQSDGIMQRRYISNNITPQPLQYDPADYLKASLEATLKQTPPRTNYQECHLGGLYTGYTGLAYLFLCISTLHPDLTVLGHDCRFWAERYLNGDRGNLRIRKGNCGISCEKLAFQALRACVTQDPVDVIDFVANAPSLIGPYASCGEDPFPSDVVTGRAGALYLMRMVKHWVPSMASCIDSPIDRLVEKLIEKNDDGDFNWTSNGTRNFGAAHGEIGIITQLVLARPCLATQFADRLKTLLDLQKNGNWPSSEADGDSGKKDLVQWCHGATGFVYSLEALRPHFPAMRPKHPDMRIRIDAAISDAKQLVWEKGLLTKEPSLCHGILGNARLKDPAQRRKTRSFPQPRDTTLREQSQSARPKDVRASRSRQSTRCDDALPFKCRLGMGSLRPRKAGDDHVLGHLIGYDKPPNLSSASWQEPLGGTGFGLGVMIGRRRDPTTSHLMIHSSQVHTPLSQIKRWENSTLMCRIASLLAFSFLNYPSNPHHRCNCHGSLTHDAMTWCV